MIQVKFGEQSSVRYNTGLLQKSVLSSGAKGAVVFLDGNPVVIDSAWSPTVKRTVDIESADFYNRHVNDLAKPRRRYYFLVARFDFDESNQVIGNSFRLEYLDLGSGTYKEFCDGSVAQPNYNGAVLTKVDKVVEGKSMSYIKPYASFIQLPQDAQAKVDKIKNDPNEVANLWKEFQKSIYMIDGATFEKMLSGESATQTAQTTTQNAVQSSGFTSPVQPQQAQQATQTAQTQQVTAQPTTAQPKQGEMPMFGSDPFADDLPSGEAPF